MDLAAPNFNFPTQLDPNSPLLRFIPSPASAPAIPAPVLGTPVASSTPASGTPAFSLRNPSGTAAPATSSFPIPRIAPPANLNQVLANNSQLLSQNHDNLNQDLLTTKALAREQAAQQRVNYLTHTGSGVDQIAHPLDANGNPSTQHPGFWRTLGSIGAHIGDDVLSIAAPGVAALTPGTTLHHQMLLNQAEGQQGQATQDLQAQANLARTGADTANENAATNLLLHPRPKYQPLSTATGIDNYDPATGAAIPVMGSNGQSVMPYVKPGPIEPKTILGPDGKTPIFANYQNGQYLDAQGKPIPNAQPYEKPAPPKNMEAKTLQLPGGRQVAGKVDSQGNLLLENGQPAPQGTILYAAPPFSLTGNWQPMEGKDAQGNLVPGSLNSRTGQFKPLSSGQAGALPKDVTAELGKEMSTAREADRRLAIMEENMNSALKTNDQQAMLSLLSNHLGMTMGAQKGARMNQQLIEEAEKSRPWLQGMETKFDPKTGYLTGVTLSREQMQQMVDLAQTVRDQQWNQVHQAFGQYGIPINSSGPDGGSVPGAQGTPQGMVQVQIPGQHSGYIPSSALKEFRKDHPNAQVTQ